VSEPADTLRALLVPGLVRYPDRLVILIDGGSGSGKTTLATEFAAALATTGRPVHRIGLDEFYPGWDGLAAASAMVVDGLLHPTDPGYVRWDWAADRPADRVRLDPAEDLLIEGCGALTPQSAAYATLTVWLERPAATRKALALARDGESFAQHWDQWAAQEHRHWRGHHPRELADLVLCFDGGV
jgi:uridine kinase